MSNREFEINQIAGIEWVFENLYYRHGRDAALDLADRLYWKNWQNCGPCEAKTPFIGDTCLLCGSEKEGDSNQPAR